MVPQNRNSRISDANSRRLSLISNGVIVWTCTADGRYAWRSATSRNVAGQSPDEATEIFNVPNPYSRTSGNLAGTKKRSARTEPSGSITCREVLE
jgi:hypothetical protein